MTATPTPSLRRFQQSFAARLLRRDEDAADLGLDLPGITVHAHNVLASLARALDAAFPVLHQLVGRGFFAAMAARFVTDRPPRLGWLSAYGSDFPDYVDVYPPAAGVGYLADVAKIEWARIHAANADDAPALDLQALAATPAQELEGLRLRLHPAASLISSAFPVFDIWQAHHLGLGEDRLADIDLAAGPQGVAVTRLGPTDVGVAALSAGDAALLASIDRWAPFGSACQTAIDAEANYDLGAGLARLASLRALALLGA
jgi:hypothetical protein